MKPTPRRALLCTALLAVVAAFALACDSGSETASGPAASAAAASPTPPQAPAGPADFTVLAGADSGAVDLEVFLPDTISIRAGDSITWRGKGPEGHSVVFLPDDRIDVLGPYFIDAPDMPGAKEFSPKYTIGTGHTSFTPGEVISSGYFGVPQEGEYTLTFPDPGVYTYLCMIHPLTMRGAVAVNDAGAPVAGPKAVLAQAERERDALIAASLQQQRAAEETLRADAAGNPGVHTIATGLDTEWGQVVAFVPGNIEVAPGNTVIFSNSPRDFHNVVFAPADYPVPPFPIIKPAESGFRLIINPESEREVPPPPGFGPDDYFSSGIMGITFPRMTWAVRFDTPGVYHYQCTVHVLAGMAGVITVRERAQ